LAQENAGFLARLGAHLLSACSLATIGQAGVLVIGGPPLPSTSRRFVTAFLYDSTLQNERDETPATEASLVMAC
jgi:hypothetical protein